MPNSQDWIKALKLLIASYCGAVVFMFVFWVDIFIAIFLSIATLNSTPLIFGFFGLGILFVGLVWFILTAFVWAGILRLFWSDPPKWISPTLDIQTIALNYGISVWATLPISIIWFIKVSANAQLDLLDFPKVFRTYPPDLIISLFWLWFIVAALGCSYQRRTQR